MKKIFLLFFCLTLLFSLPACGRKADPLVVPDSEDIVSIDVVSDSGTVTHEDRDYIEAVLTGLSAAKPTRKQSVQDFPNAEGTLLLQMNFSEGASSIFVYEQMGSYYAEQPYEGIYELDAELFQLIQGEN